MHRRRTAANAKKDAELQRKANEDALVDSQDAADEMDFMVKKNTKAGPHSKKNSGVSIIRTGNKVAAGKRAPSKWARVIVPSFSRYKKVPGWTPNPVTVLIVTLMVRCSGAVYNGIADCDETYNYWEPLHFLIYGHGFETWEYSPQFSLRSYLFLLPFTAVGKLLAAGDPYGTRKLMTFYVLRVIQAVVASLVETYLYDSVVWRFGKQHARVFFMFMLASAGMYRASVELLPSSFCMICVELALALWMVGEYTWVILVVGVAALIGWPFAALVGAPMAIHISFRSGFGHFLRVTLLWGVLLMLILLAVDSYFYGRPTIAPLNLFIYNVLPNPGAGPEIFGVEEWTYYAYNLVLNFGIIAALVFPSPWLWIIDSYIVNVWPSRKDALSRIIYFAPLIPWMMVLGNAPHKEERFLAPIYPFICLIGAVTLCDVLNLFFGHEYILAEQPQEDSTLKQDGKSKSNPKESSTSPTPTGKTYVKGNSTRLDFVLKSLLTFIVVAVAVAGGVSRTYGQINGYHASMEAWKFLAKHELQQGVGPKNADLDISTRDSTKYVNICVEKEWYRFPSHFFLQSKRFRVRFLKHEGFDGLLPKYYSENPGVWKLGTRVPPRGMNKYNKEDPNQYFKNASQCHYLVDLHLDRESSEKSTILPAKDSFVIWQEPFLDAERSPSLYRAFYIPKKTPQKVFYGNYQIIRNLGKLPVRHNQASSSFEDKFFSHRHEGV